MALLARGLSRNRDGYGIRGRGFRGVRVRALRAGHSVMDHNLHQVRQMRVPGSRRCGCVHADVIRARMRV